MKVMVFGIPRSGTTLVWQIANHFFPGEVENVHHYIETDKPTIVIYRDFRDVFCSYLKTITGRPFPETPIGLIYSELDFMRDGLKSLHEYETRRKDALFIRYENGVDTKRIANYLGFKIENKERDEIDDKFSIGVNNKIAIRRAAAGKTFHDGHDPKSGIHAYHVSGVDWKLYRHWVGHLFAKDLLEWGYV